MCELHAFCDNFLSNSGVNCCITHDLFRLFAFSAYAFLVHQRVLPEWFP